MGTSGVSSGARLATGSGVSSTFSFSTTGSSGLRVALQLGEGRLAQERAFLNLFVTIDYPGHFLRTSPIGPAFGSSKRGGLFRLLLLAQGLTFQDRVGSFRNQELDGPDGVIIGRDHVINTAADCSLCLRERRPGYLRGSLRAQPHLRGRHRPRRASRAGASWRAHRKVGSIGDRSHAG